MKFKLFILSSVLSFLFFIVEKTSSWEFRGTKLLKKLIKSDRPILICLWHGHFIFSLIYLKRFLKNAKIISSTHKDSMILANVLQKYGFDLIKGSSTRGARNVLRKMIIAYKNPESIIAITNDGPKGPPRVAKEGSVALAHKMNAHLVFIGGKSNRFWNLKTWDRFLLPKLFSKNVIYIDEMKVPKNINKKELALFVTSAMNQKQDDIEAKK